MCTPSLIVVLLLIRGIYCAVAVSMGVPGRKVAYYLLVAVLLFEVKALVPGRKDIVLPAHEHMMDLGAV